MGSGNGVPDRFRGRDGGQRAIGKVGVDVHLAGLLGAGGVAEVLGVSVVRDVRRRTVLLKLEKQ